MSQPDPLPRPSGVRRNVWTDLYDQDIERLTDERDAWKAYAESLEALIAGAPCRPTPRPQVNNAAS